MVSATTVRPDGTMKSFVQSRKRIAPPGEPSWLRSGKKQKVEAVSPITIIAEQQPVGEIPELDPPRSQIYTPPEAPAEDMAMRQLDGEVVELFYKISKGVGSLRCRVNVFIDRFGLRVDFRKAESGSIRHAAEISALRGDDVSPVTNRTKVEIKEILAEDDERYTCRVETVVQYVKWDAKIVLEKVLIDESLVVQWLATSGETGVIRETIEVPISPDVEAQFQFFRTVSITKRPRPRDTSCMYTFLVTHWNRSRLVELEGTVVDCQVVYRGDEREKRLWLKLKLRLLEGHSSSRYIYVSGDVESESWEEGRFRDDFPGQLFEE